MVEVVLMYLSLLYLDFDLCLVIVAVMERIIVNCDVVDYAVVVVVVVVLIERQQHVACHQNIVVISSVLHLYCLLSLLLKRMMMKTVRDQLHSDVIHQMDISLGD